jgi:prolycopene isomerase
MSYDVVVVGGGIGGLTVAALLSARGVDTCLLERQSQVGGCIGRVEFSGHAFDPGMGLYTSFGPDEVYDRLFSQLSVDPPEASLLKSDYVVRLFDGSDVQLSKNDAFFAELERSFPECRGQAIKFYKTAEKAAAEVSRRGQLNRKSGAFEKIRAFRPTSLLQDIQRLSKTTALDHLGETSERFQSFIDAQLRAFLQTPIDRCSFPSACVAVCLPRSNLYSIAGGPARLAESLANAIKQSGGTVRLDTPVLRLSYDEAGQAIGVDLLSGETIVAKRAIVSNMTIWDTYGKLVGLNRTPPAIKKYLATLESRGAYLIYASMEETAMTRLPAERLLVAGRSAGKDTSDTESNFTEFSFAAPSVIEQKASAKKRSVTVKSGTDVMQWFSFQESEEDYEERDQSALELCWTRLHQAVPELGGDIEVIETANPRTFYDLTRRKLGMVLGVERTPEAFEAFSHRTVLPNLFIVGDTITSGIGLAAVTESAISLANDLTK